MSIAAGIETVASRHSATSQGRASVETAANAQSAGQLANSPSSSASGTWSFRSSWLSMLASMGAGLDGPAAGADAENESSASAKEVLAQPDRGALAAAATLSSRMVPVARRESTWLENHAIASQTGSQSGGSVAQVGSETERKDTGNPVRSSESAMAAESASVSHSAISKRNTKPESSTGAATDGSLALAMLAPGAASPDAKAAEAPRSSQDRLSEGSKTASAEDFVDPSGSGLATASGHAPPAIPQATELGRSAAEDFDEVGAVSPFGQAEAQSSARTRPWVEEPEPAQVLSGSVVQPQLGEKGLEPTAGLDAGNEGSGTAKPVLAQPDRAALTAAVTLSSRAGPVAQQEGTQPGNSAANAAIPSQIGSRSSVSIAQAGSETERGNTANPVRSSESAQPAGSARSIHLAISKRSVKLESTPGAATDGSLALAMPAPGAASAVANAAEAPRNAQARFSAESHAVPAEDTMNPANSGFGTAAGHAPPASAAIAQATGRGTSIGENLDGVGAASSAGKTEAQSSERARPRVEEPEPAQVLSESLVQPHLGMQGLETAVVRDAGGGSGHAAAAPASQVEQFSATLPAAGRPGSASSSRSSTQATSRVAHGQNLAQPAEHERGALSGQSAAQSFDATTLSRDPAGLRDAISDAADRGGNSAGKAAGMASGETFAALDAETAPGTPTWIHAGLQRAEAGFQDPALGWVGVRADLSAGGVHASLVPGSTDAAQTLGRHLAGLNSYLAEQHAPIETVTLAAPESKWAGPLGDQGASPGNNQGAGHGGFSESQSNPPPSTVLANFSEDSAQTARPDAEGAIAPPGGAYISLMA